jgi:hypothetical protein
MFDLNEIPQVDGGGERLQDGDISKFTIEIQPGGYTDLLAGLPDGIATEGQTGSLFIKMKLTTAGNQWIYHRLGIHSPKGPNYKNMGLRDARRILDSHYGLRSDDVSDEAIAKRKLRSFAELNGMVIQARVKKQKDSDYLELDTILTASDAEYLPF